MQNAERDTRFENPVTAQIALIEAKAQAYEALSRKTSQSGSKFLDTIRELFRRPKKEAMENDGVNVDAKNNQPKL